MEAEKAWKQTTTGSYARQKTKHPLFDSVHRRIDVPNIEM
jgi:hypothetical protein